MIFTKHGPVELYAEVKTSSPDGWLSRYTYEELMELAEKYADVIAIHTRGPWNENPFAIEEARKRTGKRILANGIHTHDDDIRRALDAGADAVLVVGRVPQYMPECCIVEPLSLDGLEQLPQRQMAAWNARDKRISFQDARMRRPDLWMMQVSLVQKFSDIAPNANAVLVGTNLPQFIESIKHAS